MSVTLNQAEIITFVSTIGHESFKLLVKQESALSADTLQRYRDMVTRSNERSITLTEVNDGNNSFEEFVTWDRNASDEFEAEETMQVINTRSNTPITWAEWGEKAKAHDRQKFMATRQTMRNHLDGIYKLKRLFEK